MQVVANEETVTIIRPNGKNVVLISEAELSSLLETLHLLRSPANATRLLTALERAKAKTISPQTVGELCQRLNLSQDNFDQDNSDQDIAAAS
jgi:antitoxin YefM